MPENENILSADKQETKAEKICIRIIVEGKVQKVGYRNWLRDVCVKNHVTGWVRNKSEQTVKAVLYGDEKTARNVICNAINGLLLQV